MSQGLPVTPRADHVLKTHTSVEQEGLAHLYASHALEIPVVTNHPKQSSAVYAIQDTLDPTVCHIESFLEYQHSNLTGSDCRRWRMQTMRGYGMVQTRTSQQLPSTLNQHTTLFLPQPMPV